MFCTLQSYTFNFKKCETQVIRIATNVHRFSLILLTSETLKLQKPKRPSATKTFNSQKPYSLKPTLEDTCIRPTISSTSSTLDELAVSISSLKKFNTCTTFLKILLSASYKWSMIYGVSYSNYR